MTATLAEALRAVLAGARRELADLEAEALRYAPPDLRAEVHRLRRIVQAGDDVLSYAAGVPIVVVAPVVPPAASSWSTCPEAAPTLPPPRPPGPIPSLDPPPDHRAPEPAAEPAAEPARHSPARATCRRLFASPTPLLPCAQCGRSEDYAPGTGQRRPPRYDGAPWGVDGLICYRCWRAHRRPERGTAAMPPRFDAAGRGDLAIPIRLSS